MKIKPEHYQHLEATMRAFMTAHPAEVAHHRAAHTKKRFAWDIFRAAGLTTYCCDVLYAYLNDSHIETAVLKICKEA